MSNLEVLHSNYALISIASTTIGSMVIGAVQDLTIRYNGDMAQIDQVGSSDICSKMPAKMKSEVTFRYGLVDLELLKTTMDLDTTTSRGYVLEKTADGHQSGIFEKFTLTFASDDTEATATTTRSVEVPDIRLNSYELDVSSGEFIIANAEGIGDAPKIS